LRPVIRGEGLEEEEVEEEEDGWTPSLCSSCGKLDDVIVDEIIVSLMDEVVWILLEW